VNVRLTFLGTGTPLGLRGLHQSCILLETHGQRLLLDCGMTAVASLGRIGVDAAEIDAIIVSHLHGDHFGGIPLLLLDAALRGRARPLIIAGPRRTRERVNQTLKVFGWQNARLETATFVQLVPGEPVTIAGCEVTAFEVSHDRETEPLGLRVVADGAIVGYSGDAGWSEALVKIAHGADLFICGVWSVDMADPTFIDMKTLVEHRAQLDCKRIILTHLGPSMLEHLPQVQFDVAHDGLRIEI
jgi:ribonuclease BN (tRNA processing enzyme)